MAVLKPDMLKVETTIIDLTNTFRRQNRLERVVRNARLDKTARYFAQYLASTGKFAHEADGRQPADRAKAHGYKFCQIAENLALHLDSRGFASKQLAGLAVTGWINSPGHRRNMLRPHVTEIGVAVAKAPFTPKYLSVQLFGRPISFRYSFKIANRSDATIAYSLGPKQSFRLRPREIVTHEQCQPVTISLPLKVETGWLSSLWASTNKRLIKAKAGEIYTLRNDKKGYIRVDRGA